MRNREKIYILCASFVLMLTTFGCSEVVTDVNAYLTPPEGSVAMESLQTSKKETNEEVQNTEKQDEEDENVEDNDVSADTSEDTNESVSGTEDNDESEVETDLNDDGTDEDNTEEDQGVEDGEGESEEDALNDVENGDDVNANEGEDTSQEEEIVIPDTFDPVFYAEHNPDVVSVFGDTPEVLYKHYLEYGMAEGRAASENADVIPESEDNAN